MRVKYLQFAMIGLFQLAAIRPALAQPATDAGPQPVLDAQPYTLFAADPSSVSSTEPTSSTTGPNGLEYDHHEHHDHTDYSNYPGQFRWEQEVVAAFEKQ